jgi:hypothetical protein
VLALALEAWELPQKYEKADAMAATGAAVIKLACALLGAITSPDDEIADKSSS